MTAGIGWAVHDDPQTMPENGQFKKLLFTKFSGKKMGETATAEPEVLESDFFSGKERETPGETPGEISLSIRARFPVAGSFDEAVLAATLRCPVPSVIFESVTLYSATGADMVMTGPTTNIIEGYAYLVEDITTGVKFVGIVETVDPGVSLTFAQAWQMTPGDEFPIELGAVPAIAAGNTVNVKSDAFLAHTGEKAKTFPKLAFVEHDMGVYHALRAVEVSSLKTALSRGKDVTKDITGKSAGFDGRAVGYDSSTWGEHTQTGAELMHQPQKIAVPHFLYDAGVSLDITNETGGGYREYEASEPGRLKSGKVEVSGTAAVDEANNPVQDHLDGLEHPEFVYLVFCPEGVLVIYGTGGGFPKPTRKEIADGQDPQCDFTYKIFSGGTFRVFRMMYT